jgi:predicted  nucleic acid-binding Zn-ribbon protein
MEETLRVKVVGEGGQLTKTLGELTSQLKRFQESLKTSGNVESFNRIQRAADATRQRIEALNKTSQGVQKVTKDFTGFSRVIQDLPFGFIAISNNLEQLVPAAGAAGLAFSGLISVLSFAQIGFSNWTRGLFQSGETLEDQVKKLNDAKTALSNYVELLNDRSKIQVIGTQNAQEDLVKLQTLYKATQDGNIPIAQRKKLIDELQEQYPKYFKNISDETILNGGAKKAYDDLALSILAASRARAGQDLLVEVQKESIVLDQQQTEILQKEFDAAQKLGRARQTTKEAQKQGAQMGQAAVFYARQEENAEKEINRLQKEGSDIQKKRIALEERRKNISKEVTDIVEKHPEVLIDPTGDVKTPHVKKEVVLDLRVRHINFIAPDDFFARDPATTFKINQDFQKVVAASLENTPIKPRVNIAPDVALITPDEALLQTKILAFTEQVNSMLTAAGGEMAAAFGQTLGDIFSGKGLTSAFSNIANVLGGFIQDLGKLLIKNAIEVQLFKKALAGLIGNPALALAVGIGLVAVGGIIKNSVPSVPKFAKGGLVSGATLGLIGEGIGTSAANPEIVTPLDKLKGMIAPQSDTNPQVIMHTISGDELRLWIQRADKKGGRY